MADSCSRKPMPDRRRYRLFRLVFFAMQLPVGIAFPYYLLHLRKEVGLSAQQLSYVTVVGGLTMVCFQQVWGYVADCLVSKKLLILMTSTMAGIAFLFAGKVTSFGAVLGTAFFFYLFSTPIQQLLIGFLFTHEGSSRRFGTLRGYASFGFVVANLGVAYVADKVTGGSLEFVFPLLAVVYSASAVLLVLIPEKPFERHDRRPGFLEVQRFFFSRPAVALFLLLTFVYQVAHSFSFVVQSFVMSDMGADKRLVALSYSAAAILEIPVFFSANYFIRRFGEVRLLMFASLVQALRWGLVWMAGTPGQIIAISLLHCITFGLFFAAGVSFINRHAGLHYKASAQTMLAFVYSGLAPVVGNLVGGQVAGNALIVGLVHRVLQGWLGLPERTALQNLYVFCALLAVVPVFIGIRLIALERQTADLHPDAGMLQEVPVEIRD